MSALASVPDPVQLSSRAREVSIFYMQAQCRRVLQCQWKGVC